MLVRQITVYVVIVTVPLLGLEVQVAIACVSQHTVALVEIGEWKPAGLQDAERSAQRRGAEVELAVIRLQERIAQPEAHLGAFEPRILAGRHRFAAVRRACIKAPVDDRVGLEVSEGSFGHQAPPGRRERQIVQSDVSAVVSVLLQVVEPLTRRLRERQLEEAAAKKRLRVLVVSGRKEQVRRCRPAARAEVIVQKRGDWADVAASEQDAALREAGGIRRGLFIVLELIAEREDRGAVLGKRQPITVRAKVIPERVEFGEDAMALSAAQMVALREDRDRLRG